MILYLSGGDFHFDVLDVGSHAASSRFQPLAG